MEVILEMCSSAIRDDLTCVCVGGAVGLGGGVGRGVAFGRGKDVTLSALTHTIRSASVFIFKWCVCVCVYLSVSTPLICVIPIRNQLNTLTHSLI